MNSLHSSSSNSSVNNSLDINTPGIIETDFKSGKLTIESSSDKAVFVIRDKDNKVVDLTTKNIKPVIDKTISYIDGNLQHLLSQGGKDVRKFSEGLDQIKNALIAIKGEHIKKSNKSLFFKLSNLGTLSKIDHALKRLDQFKTDASLTSFFEPEIESTNDSIGESETDFEGFESNETDDTQESENHEEIVSFQNNDSDGIHKTHATEHEEVKELTPEEKLQKKQLNKQSEMLNEIRRTESSFNRDMKELSDFNKKFINLPAGKLNLSNKRKINEALAFANTPDKIAKRNGVVITMDHFKNLDTHLNALINASNNLSASIGQESKLNHEVMNAYEKNLSEYGAALTEFQKNYDIYTDLADSLKAAHLGKGTNLANLIIMPIQRGPRHLLFLKGLYEQTSDPIFHNRINENMDKLDSILNKSMVDELRTGIELLNINFYEFKKHATKDDIKNKLDNLLSQEPDAIQLRNKLSPKDITILKDLVKKLIAIGDFSGVEKTKFYTLYSALPALPT